MRISALDDEIDPPPPRFPWKYVLFGGIALLMGAGIALVFLIDWSSPPPPPAEKPPDTPQPAEKFPLSPAELLEDLNTATKANDRGRVARLLTDDWREFVEWADREMAGIQKNRTAAAEAVTKAAGPDAARRVQELPSLDWKPFDGIDWAAATLPKSQAGQAAPVRAGELEMTAEKRGDGSWRLRPPGAADEAVAEIRAAAAPVRDTYAQLKALAESGRLTAENIGPTLQSVRLEAVLKHSRPPIR